jgi:hypothetical protein
LKSVLKQSELKLKNMHFKETRTGILYVFVFIICYFISGCFLKTRNKILQDFRKFEMSLDSIHDPGDYWLTRIDSIARQGGAPEQGCSVKARSAKLISNAFADYVQVIKDTLSSQNGGREEDGQLKNASNLEAAEKFFAGKSGEQTKGRELKNMINNTREQLLNLLDEDDRLKINSEFIAEDSKEPGARSWEQEFFYQMPLGAAMALLTNYQNMARQLSSDIIKMQYDKISGKKPGFSK